MEEKPSEHKKLLAVGIVTAVVTVLVIAAVIVMAILSGGGTKPTSTPSDNTATTLFYDTLGNAAKQQQLRVAMYRATYATKADADTKQKIGTEASSVAEVDIADGKVRSVYATSVSRTTEFSIGRCMDTTEYNDDYFISKQPRPTSLAAAADALKTNERLYKVTEPLVFVVCPSLGIMPNAVLDLASFRLSDGIFPVTLTEGQAKNWKAKLQEANLFTTKDEGVVERDGQQVRKVSFSPTSQDGVNRRLYDIFYEAGEIEKVKREHPEAHWQYEFLTVNPANTGSVSGFYLIDETTRLPVYSEISGINEDKKVSERSARFNIARTKQTYSFGKPLSLTMESPLELLE
jgi:hypothetical protein